MAPIGSSIATSLSVRRGKVKEHSQFFIFFPDFFLFFLLKPDFLPLFTHFWQIFHCQGGRVWPSWLPRWLHHCHDCLQVCSKMLPPFFRTEYSYIPIFPNYTMIVTKLAGLFTLWVDIEKRACSWMQYKCSRRSARHGMRVDICASGLPLLVDKENVTIPTF